MPLLRHGDFGTGIPVLTQRVRGERQKEPRDEDDPRLGLECLARRDRVHRLPRPGFREEHHVHRLAPRPVAAALERAGAVSTKKAFREPGAEARQGFVLGRGPPGRLGHGIPGVGDHLAPGILAAARRDRQEEQGNRP